MFNRKLKEKVLKLECGFSELMEDHANLEEVVNLLYVKMGLQLNDKDFISGIKKMVNK